MKLKKTEPHETLGMFDGLATYQNPVQARMTVLKVAINHVNDSHNGIHPDIEMWENELDELTRINNTVHSPASGIFTIKGVSK